MSWPLSVTKLCIKMSNIRRNVIKIVEIRFIMRVKIIESWPHDVKLTENFIMYYAEFTDRQ
jgi:hypothetical protein